MGKVCQVCGKPSGMYPLCKDCFVLRDNGEVVKDEASGKWVLVKESSGKSSAEILSQTKFDNCVICNQSSSGKPLCKDCYYDCREMEDEIDRNKKPFELRDYYYNLKSANYRIVNKNTIINNCKKMIALANITNDSYDDTSLVTRVIEDVKEIIVSKNSKKDIKINTFTEQSDSLKSNIIRTLDGHIVKSRGEEVIDNILYNNLLPHCYEKEVTEISTNERSVKSDWFIPVFGNNKGIYVEYWGMSTDDYKKNKEEKKSLYEKYNIPLIEIQKDDINNPSELSTRILKLYNTLKDEIKKSM